VEQTLTSAPPVPGGHPVNGHVLFRDGPPVIAFDVGGTHIRCVVVAGHGNLTEFEKDRIPSVPLGATLEDVTETLVETIGRYAERVGGVVDLGSPIAISVPGPVTRDGVVLTAAPLFGDQCAEFPLARLVTSRTGRVCFVVNDVSAATWYLSNRIPAQRFLVVTVSSGIGSKVFDRSRRFSVLDDTGYAGEIGHVTVDSSSDALLCDCGGRGHLSSFSSGRGVERWARLLAAADGAAFARSVACELSQGRADLLTNELHIVPAVLAGDEWATGVVRRCTYPLGHMLRTIAVTNAVESIAVIGGFAASLGGRYLDILQEALDENQDFAILKPFLSGLLWREAEVPEECLLGAATYGRVRASEQIGTGLSD
jgi:C7-cyclitol 7-kinase